MRENIENAEIPKINRVPALRLVLSLSELRYQKKRTKRRIPVTKMKIGSLNQLKIKLKKGVSAKATFAGVMV